MSDRRPAALWALAACLIFLAVGALYGGGSLLSDPTGGRIGLPLELLAGSPFADYRIPGAVLFLLFGLGPWAVVPALLSRRSRRVFAGHAWPWLAAFTLASGLIVWLVVQAAVIGLAGGIQIVYGAFAGSLLALTLAVRRRFRTAA